MNTGIRTAGAWLGLLGGGDLRLKGGGERRGLRYLAGLLERDLSRPREAERERALGAAGRVLGTDSGAAGRVVGATKVSA